MDFLQDMLYAKHASLRVLNDMLHGLLSAFVFKKKENTIKLRVQPTAWKELTIY